MSVHQLQAAFTGSNLPRGLVLPVTMFMEVSAYPNAEAAMAALQQAKQALKDAQDRVQVLRIELARMMRTGDAPSIEYEAYSFKDEIDYADRYVRDCREEVWAVEERMGLFHPKHRALLAGWVESAIGLLDNLDAPQSEDEPLFVGQSDGLPGSPEDTDTGDAEDEFTSYSGAGKDGPGCKISDPDLGVEDGQFDGEEDRCDAGDDGCGPIFKDGHLWWGSNADADSDHALPCAEYGIDQTKPGILPDLAGEQAIIRPHLKRARERLKTKFK